METDRYDYWKRIRNKDVRKQLEWGRRAHEMDPRLREHLHEHPELYGQIDRVKKHKKNKGRRSNL